MRANKSEGLGKLDALKLGILEYLPLTTRAMERGARFGAESRQRGLPTCRDAELDADAILAAQAATHPEGATNVVIATTNVGDLAQFVAAKLWQDIR